MYVDATVSTARVDIRRSGGVVWGEMAPNESSRDLVPMVRLWREMSVRARLPHPYATTTNHDGTVTRRFDMPWLWVCPVSIVVTVTPSPPGVRDRLTDRGGGHAAKIPHFKRLILAIRENVATVALGRDVGNALCVTVEDARGLARRE